MARLLATVYLFMVRVDITCEPCEVNGQPGALFRDRDGKVLHVLAFMLKGQIRIIRSVINPDKLGPVADAWAVDREMKQTRNQTG